ncbi:MAG: hypothetical protein CM15mP40_09620 [Alphaproteobacteria bacterium]|nr:MAG: hypothetical protein CM15mP40_09620 [Alphaproteobacteria bacterium]
MDFLRDYIEKDPSGNISTIIVILTILLLIFVVSAFLFDYFKNDQNSKKTNMLERAIKDLIEEFRSLEINLSEQKKILNDYKYTLEKLDLEISRLADSNKGDSNITTAIQMANQGRSLEEISSATGLNEDEIEPILKYHGK